MSNQNEYVGSRIIKLERGEVELGRDKYVYAVLVDKNGDLLISATVDYIAEVLPSRLPPSIRAYGEQILAKVLTAVNNGDYSDSPPFI